MPASPRSEHSNAAPPATPIQQSSELSRQGDGRCNGVAASVAPNKTSKEELDYSLFDCDADEAARRVLPMESTTESKGSDEGSPGEVEEQPARPAGPPAPPPPVDGGLQCWLQVVGALGIWINTWGLVNAYGAFQTYYEVDGLPNNTPSQISWIGSIQAFLLLFLGALSGPIFDAGYFKHLVVVGNFLVVFGLMMTSICKEYWQFILAQGLCCGLGFGFLFAPSIAIIPQYFVKKRAIAGGIAASGTGLGGVIYPIILHELQPRIGFGWTLRIIGFIALFWGIISFVTMRNKLPAGKMRKLYDPTFFRNPAILWYAAGGFFSLMGIYGPVYYIGTYALELHITGPNLAFYLLPILMASSAVGRIVPNFFADKTGLVNMLVPTALGAGILSFAWIAIKDEAGLIVFAVLYGVFSGLLLSLAPTGAPLFVADPKKIGTNIGMVFMIISIGVLIGTPILGALLGGGRGFIGLQAFSGAALAFSALLYAAARIAKVGAGWKKL